MYFHFSEDPTITDFEPRQSNVYPDHPPLVWAIDDWHAPLYFFPRDCPRVAFWAGPGSTKADVDKFLSYSQAKMIIAVESDWLRAIKKTQLYRYTFSPDPFFCFDVNAGYYTTYEKVTPISVEPVGDLLDCLVRSDVEIRITPSLHLLHETIADTSLSFSMIRMRNAKIRKS